MSENDSVDEEVECHHFKLPPTPVSKLLKTAE